MKASFLKLSFLLLCVSSAKTICQAQSYFDEALKITSLNISSASDIKDAKAKDDIKKFVESFMAYKKGTKSSDTPATSAPAQGGASQNGDSYQNIPSSNNYDSTGLMNEVKVFFQLSKLSNEDFLSALDGKNPLVIPSQFKFLNEIVQYNSVPIGIGNTTAANNNFSFSEADIIYGITDFAIKRAKAELADVYLKEWYAKLSDNKIIAPLIPQSLNTFDSFIKTDALNLAKYGDKWKAAFQEDLHNLPLKLQDEVYIKTVLDKYKVNDANEVTSVITGGNELIYNLYLKKNIVTVVSNMANRYCNNQDQLLKFQKVVVMANLIAISVGNFDDQNNYQTVSLSKIKKMNRKSWEIFFKLLYSRNKKEIDKLFPEEKKFLETEKLKKLEALLPESVSIINSFQDLITSQSGQSKLTFDDVSKLFDIAFQLLDNTSAYFTAYNQTDFVKEYNTKIEPYFSLLTEIGDGISSQQYGKVLDGTVGVLKLLRGKENQNDQSIENLERYGSFMLNVLAAKSSDDVEAALDEIIPKDQYQLKNTKSFSISLSAYPGFMAGQEIIKKYQTDPVTGAVLYNKPKQNSVANTTGLFLPVGLDFNFHFPRVCKCSSNNTSDTQEKKYSSWNIMLQILDLGSVLSYRLTSDSTEKTNPNISFDQVLSPGIALMKHFNNSPVVVGLGANLSPSLRAVSQDGLQYDANSLRYFAFVGVDVTFIFLHLSKKSSYKATYDKQ